MYSDFYEIPLPALHFEKVEETDTKKVKKWKRHRRETTPSKFEHVKKADKKTTLKEKQIHSQQENDAQRKADSLAKKNDTPRRLNASKTKAVVIREIKLTHNKNVHH